jgi:hypothetical protein
MSVRCEITKDLEQQLGTRGADLNDRAREAFLATLLLLQPELDTCYAAAKANPYARKVLMVAIGNPLTMLSQARGVGRDSASSARVHRKVSFNDQAHRPAPRFRCNASFG